MRVLAFVCLVSIFLNPYKSFGGTEFDRRPVDNLANRLNITIQTDHEIFPAQSSRWVINGKNPETTSLIKYLPIFVYEFSLYPPDVIKRADLERIILCEDLVFDGQRRGAIPDWANNTLYLDVARAAYDPHYQRIVIHHEFFHMIDFRDDGVIDDDQGWKALNPPSFTYGKGGKFYQSQLGLGVPDNSLIGFLNRYSTTGVDEDKAEVFANMMVNYSVVDHRAKSDPIIKAKMEYLKKLLWQFSPTFDDSFWLKISRRSALFD